MTSETGPVIVLGAGIVGVCTALQLALRGVAVHLCDRGRPEDAASFGNAGIIQSEAVMPYAFPRDLRTLLRMATGHDNAVGYDLRGLVTQGAALASYWHHSAPARHARIGAVYAGLIGQAQEDHAVLIDRAHAGNLIRKGGYFVIARDAAGLDRIAQDAAAMHRRFGVPHRVVAGEALTRAVPQLSLAEGGAVHWTQPWSVSDPGALISALRAAFVALGGTVARADADRLRRTGIGWALDTSEGTVEAPQVVLALGAATPAVLGRFGLRVRMVAKRGYHRHYENTAALAHPLVDEEAGVVLAPMQGGLRLTTGAALTDRAVTNPPQLRQGVRVAEKLLGHDLRPVSEVWSGLRPCLPDMLPVAGQVPGKDGLWLHFGHGHQGLTLAPTTARMLAETMTGETAQDAMLSPARVLRRYSTFEKT